MVGIQIYYRPENLLLKLRTYRFLPLILAGLLSVAAAWPSVVHVCSMAGHGMHFGLVDPCCPPANQPPAESGEAPCHPVAGAIDEGIGHEDRCCSISEAERESGLSSERIEVPIRTGLVWESTPALSLDLTASHHDSRSSFPDPFRGRSPSLRVLHVSFLI